MDTQIDHRPRPGADNTLSGGGEMSRLMRKHDWSSTPLGPVEDWPQSLRTAVSICLASQFPILIWWGPDFVKLYNDAYRLIIGKKHPKALGQPGRECWPEIWDIIGPMLEGVLTKGEATWSENQLLLLERNGYAEECYFTFSYSPIRDETGEVGGVFTAVTETTQQILGERRLRTLRALAANTAEAHTPEEVCTIAVRTLSDNPADLPFALLYLLTPDGKDARLTGTTGLPADTSASPACIALADETAPWPLAPVAETGLPVLLNDLAARFGDISSYLSHEDMPAPHTTLVLPVTRAGQPHPYGFLVAGISSRRLLDEDYRGFLSLVAGQVATAIATARAYQDAQERAEALAELDRAKTAFFSNISHEFRTPLTLSLGPLDAVLSDSTHPLSEEQRAQLEMVRRNALRQFKLVNTLLDFARIEAGRVEAAYLPTDLARLTTDLASAFQSAIEKAGLQLIVECSPLPEPIYVDRDMWEKIVLNLLSNAFKFTFEGLIRIALHPVEEAVELVVQDTGVGVSEEDLPHLFERFYRVRQTRARTYEGSGIGLSLVQELVRLNGGTIAVQSTEGVGTTFTVRLPRGSAHLPADRLGAARRLSSTALGADPYVEEALRWLPVSPQSTDEAPPGEPGGRAPSLTTSPPLVNELPNRSSRLLVVDDNADMRDYLKWLLSPSYQVTLAADGNTALALAQGARPDLIISDVMMPGLDGFALLKALRDDPGTSAIPIILLSARAGEEATVEGLQAGANDYLIKPFSAREVLARVQARLEIARLRREAEVARERLHDLFMQAPALIAVLHGPTHVFELANSRYAQIVGRGASRLLGKPAREALPEFEGQGYFELLDTVYRSGEPFVGYEMRALIDRNQDGQLEEGYFNFVYQPSRAATGAVDGILVHAVEVTEQVRARQRMDTFLGIASHELKNPLTSIKGNVQLARRQVARAMQEVEQEHEALRRLLDGVGTMLERAERQIGFQNRLVSDLVDMTRIQAEKLELRQERADLITIIREAVEEQRQLTPTRTIRLNLPAGGTLPPVVDADRIGQVVTNYLSNALKYSEEERDVAVSVESTRTGVRVAVRDEGPGLIAQEQERIWERFYRVPGVQAKSGTGMGLGLGLHICRTIIEQHGGHVGVESEPGKGSTFWFTLPL